MLFSSNLLCLEEQYSKALCYMDMSVLPGNVELIRNYIRVLSNISTSEDIDDVTLPPFNA
jgi:hypothetical protein